MDLRQFCNLTIIQEQGHDISKRRAHMLKRQLAESTPERADKAMESGAVDSVRGLQAAMEEPVASTGCCPGHADMNTG